ncbi:ABC transporter substrate-binding protein [Paenibacillus terrigena]|uniref:ABC transporter substrate-binding protein n=1 Tax=Paenibacillus terrigena TaxID=369333 RepID=UPI0028D587FB|nr:ABC transporter substrate-binding protein [Paenibacillus terrigena]
MKRSLSKLNIAILSLALIVATPLAAGSTAYAAPTKSAPTAKAAVTKAFIVKDFANREIKFTKPVSHVVVLSSGDARIMSDLGATVVGRPAIQDPSFPQAVMKAVEVGSTHKVDYEKVTALKPDLIIANVANLKDVKSLEATGAKVFLGNASSISDIQKSITLYGQMTGKDKRAAEMNTTMNKLLKAIKVDKENPKKVLLVYGAPGALLAALPTSLSGDLLAKAGGKNVAEDYPTMKEYSGYAQLSTERIITSDPDYVMLITHGDPAEVEKTFIAEIQKNAAWKNLKAVKNKKVIVLPANLFGVNPGSKVTDSLQYLTKKLQEEDK